MQNGIFFILPFPASAGSSIPAVRIHPTSIEVPMFGRALLLAACVILPSAAAAQMPATAPAKPTPAAAKADSGKPAMQHDMGGMKHEMMGHGKMDHAAPGSAAGAHDMSQCPMCQAHMKMMAFYKAILADSVIHARIRDTKALHDQHQELDDLMAKMPAHGEKGMSMDCSMMKKDKPAG
ncbi:MAG: hypothetical protein ACYC3Q_14330 [Gemmatimonadaceae bacterium]